MGIKFPTPWKTLIIKSPPPREEKGVKFPGYAWRGDVEASIWPTHYLAEEICLSSGHIAKCDPAKFSIWKKTLKIAKYIKDAVVLGWDRQILENSSLTIGITAATVSACQANVINLKNDQFEDIWNNRRNLLTFTLSLWTDETVTTLRYFNVFTKTLLMRAILKLTILRHFNVFYGNRLVNYRTVYLGKYSHRLVILRAKCSLHSQALYFLSLSLPSYWNWERRKTILWSDDQEFMFSGFISQMCQKQRQLTPTSSY